MNTMCSACGLQGYPARVGVDVIEMFQSPPVPYRITRADEWACPGCGQRWVEGYSTKATQHFEPTFMADVEEACGAVRRTGDEPGAGVRICWERADDRRPPDVGLALLQLWLLKVAARAGERLRKP